mmetsp:Transcript_5432/g.13409  ORF Transcript_5432/g.13409 Transcript_5432/m.13409 type:complete len:94 (+) Transcript_5432:1305-1586(+)
MTSAAPALEHMRKPPGFQNVSCLVPDVNASHMLARILVVLVHDFEEGRGESTSGTAGGVWQPKRVDILDISRRLGLVAAAYNYCLRGYSLPSS